MLKDKRGKRKAIPSHGKRMTDVSPEAMADEAVFEFIRASLLQSRAFLAAMSRQEQDEFVRKHACQYDDDLAKELDILPTIDELRAKYTPEALGAIRERFESLRSEQARRLVTGLGDQGRKDHQDSLLIKMYYEMSRVPSPRTGKRKSQTELVRELSKLSGTNERTIRRLLKNEREIRPTIDFSFETNRRKTKHAPN